jgi:hypothetical protein
VFYTCTINAVTTATSGVHAALSRKSAGNNATFAVGNLLFAETTIINTDYINSKRHSYLEFNTATTKFNLGDTIFRYYSNGQIAARAQITELTQTLGNANGYAIIYTRVGNTATFNPGGTNLTNTFFTVSNNQSGVSVSDVSINYLQFTSANADFSNGAYIQRYYANGTLAANAKILLVSQISTQTNGYLLTAIQPANTTTFNKLTSALITNTFYQTSNAVFATTVTEELNAAYYSKLPLNSTTFGFPRDLTANISSYNATTYQVQTFFNANSDVNDTSEFITIANNNLTTNTAVTYLVAAGNTALTNLANNLQYYVVGGNSTGVSLSASIGGTAINLTKGLTQNGHSLTKYYPTAITFNANSDVDATNDFISIPFNQFTNNTLLLYSVAGGNTVVSSLADGASYYAVNANSSGISLSSVISGSKIDLTKGLTQTGHTLTRSSVLANIFEYSSVTAGKIRTITDINQGNGYSDSPVVVVYDPTIAAYGKYDYSINYSGASGTFLVGEIITGQTSEATARIKSVNTTVLECTRLNLFKDMTSETIIGATSGVSATVTSVGSISTYSGFNAIVLGDAISTNGSVTSLRIIDSGIGYVDKEEVTFFAVDDTSKTGLATLSVTKQGTAEGRYTEQGGFLSSDKYIHDGEYYQEFSYEVQTSLPFEKYSEIDRKSVV